MTIKVGINGFGRIGRNFYRAVVSSGADVEIVGINDLTDTKTLAHLLKYDSILGRLGKDVVAGDGEIVIDGTAIPVFAERDPADLPWGKLGADIVIESTGFFTDADEAPASTSPRAPRRSSSPRRPRARTSRSSWASTTRTTTRRRTTSSRTPRAPRTASRPMAKVIDDAFGIERGLMTTIHAYTNDQNVLDCPHKDLRRARAAALNMIPTTTGAAKAIALVMPQLKGKLDGFAMRVPVPTGSATDLTVELKKPATKEEINAAIKAAAEGPLKGILQYTEDPIVSTDIVTDPARASSTPA